MTTGQVLPSRGRPHARLERQRGYALSWVRSERSCRGGARMPCEARSGGVIVAKWPHAVDVDWWLRRGWRKAMPLFLLRNASGKSPWICIYPKGASHKVCYANPKGAERLHSFIVRLST
jgi:hypothetical protein